jgi:hypothetical protein
MLLEIAQKTTIRGCFTRNFFSNIVFCETMYEDSFLLVKKLTYFMPSSKDTLPRRSEIVENQKLLTLLLRNCILVTCIMIVKCL